MKIQAHFEDLFDTNNFDIFDTLITAYRHNVKKNIKSLQCSTLQNYLPICVVRA